MDVLDKLKNLGFTTNEAKAYMALLGCQPASAYEIAKQAGLPTSKIYETVNRLKGRGVFQASEAQGTMQYFAMSPSDLMASIRSTTITETEQLLPELEKVHHSDERNLIWPLITPDQVRARAMEIIERAEDSILVSLWPEELAWCETALRDATLRGVKVALVHFGESETRIGATYDHPAEKTLYTEKGGRGLTLVVDGKTVVIASFRATGDVDGAWSSNETFVTVAEDYVKHDVYITKVTRFLGPAVIERFGQDYARLRDVFNESA